MKPARRVGILVILEKSSEERLAAAPKPGSEGSRRVITNANYNTTKESIRGLMGQAESWKRPSWGLEAGDRPMVMRSQL